VLVRYLDKSSDAFRDFRGEFQSKAGDLQSELRQVKSQVVDLSNILADFLSSNSRMDSRTRDGKSRIWNGLCVIVLTNI